MSKDNIEVIGEGADEWGMRKGHTTIMPEVKLVVGTEKKTKSWTCNYCKPGCVIRQDEKPPDGYCFMTGQVPLPEWKEYVEE